MGEKGVTILVRLMSAEGRKKYKDGLDEKYRGPSWVEFHKVHVKEEEEEEEIQVEKNCYPDLLCRGGIGRMVRAGSKLYLLGAVEEDRGKVKERSSVLDLNATHKEWEHLPLPVTAGISSFKYCAMDGKIYHYEHRHRSSGCPTGPTTSGLWAGFGYTGRRRRCASASSSSKHTSPTPSTGIASSFAGPGPSAPIYSTPRAKFMISPSCRNNEGYVTGF